MQLTNDDLRQIASSGSFSIGGQLSAPGKDLVFLPSHHDKLRFREDIGLDAPPVPPHRHMRQTERFTVIQGCLQITLENEKHPLAEGESIDVPPGKLHTYSPDPTNTHGGSVLIEVELWPAQNAQRFFETVYGLTREGRLPPKGLHDIIAFFALCHAHGFVIGGPPVVLALVLNGAAASLAALLRIDAWSKRYATKPPAMLLG